MCVRHATSKWVLQVQSAVDPKGGGLGLPFTTQNLALQC